jgi:hypothetical protein
MWHERGGGPRQQVISQCFRILGPGCQLSAGMSVIDTILDHEFGAEPPVAPAEQAVAAQPSEPALPSAQAATVEPQATGEDAVAHEVAQPSPRGE